MLSQTEQRVIDTHTHSAWVHDDGEFEDGRRVRQWENATSVYMRASKRLWVHNDTDRKQAYQELYFHSLQSVCQTMTSSHPIKFWDLRRQATPREHLRIQGFPDTFIPPVTNVARLVGNAVAVPCAEYACACVLSDEERLGDATVTHLDLCAGIGGFSCAMNRVCPRVECVGFSEVNLSATSCFLANFPGILALGDAERVSTWPTCDVVTAGFPCQPFSSANTRERRDNHDKRDFFNVVCEVIRRTNAQRVVLENVPNLLTVGRERFNDMMRQLHGMGFKTEFAVLDAVHFGIPQRRKRVYIVGRRDGVPTTKLASSYPTDGIVSTLASIVEH